MVGERVDSVTDDDAKAAAMKRKAAELTASYSSEQREALARHGYDPDVPPRGMTGPPGEAVIGSNGGRLRNRVCELDGVEIDGHRPSDLGGGDAMCIHCGKEPVDTTDDGDLIWRDPLA